MAVPELEDKQEPLALGTASSKRVGERYQRMTRLPALDIERPGVVQTCIPERALFLEAVGAFLSAIVSPSSEYDNSPNFTASRVAAVVL